MRLESSPLRVAILTSRGASGVEALVDDHRLDVIYEVVKVVDGSVRRPPRNLNNRRVSDRELAESIQEAGADFVLLAGYPWIITSPLLEAFPGRIIALHDGDLSLIDENGQRRYKGLHPVRTALFDGLSLTRSSAFVVTEKVGEGPLFLLSAPYRVPPAALDAQRRGDLDLVDAYAAVHRAWMVRDSWGPMLRRIVELLAAGTIQTIGDVVWIDGVPGPCLLGEAPDVCHHEHEESGIPRSCPFLTT
jgi:hypothetical protein